MKRMIAAVLLVVLAVGFCGCSRFDPKNYGVETLAQTAYPQGIGFEDYEQKRAVREQNLLDYGLTNTLNAFAFETGSAVLSEKENALYSPLSLYFPLALTAYGAQGETREELMRLLNGMPQSAADDAILFENAIYLPAESAEQLPSWAELGEPIGYAVRTDGSSVKVYESAKNGGLMALEDGKDIPVLYGFAGGQYDAETLAVQCGNLYRRLYTDNKIGRLQIANSLWVGQDLQLRPAFLDTAAAAFYASVYAADFGQPQTAEAMAAWVAQNTGGKLSYTPSVDPQQMMSILNTIYYYDEWTDRFDAGKTEDDLFWRTDGQTVECPFMNATYGSHIFAAGEGFTRSSLGLKNGGSMIFILPDEGVSCTQLLESPAQMQEAFFGGTAYAGEVVWQIPKFSFGAKVELQDVLRELGVEQIFGAQADFSDMADSQLWVSSVNQQSRISIDERGVEAAAYTELSYAGAAMPQGRADMILNRPFIYGIQVNGVLLFVGVCGDPTSAV